MARPENPPRREPGGSLRGLAASGPSKVGVVRAMRARDVSRIPEEDPRADDQAEGSSGSAGSSPVDS